jgi:hypothetical protein
MVLVLVVGGVLGWFIRRATIQRDAVAAIGLIAAMERKPGIGAKARTGAPNFRVGSCRVTGGRAMHGRLGVWNEANR